MLHAIAQLAEHGVRHIQWVLCDEVNADAFGAYQPDHLLNLVQQGLRAVGEQQMRLIEKEHQLGFRRIANFRQLLKQF